MPTELTIEILKRFSPMDSMKRQNLSALAKKAGIRSLEDGMQLFGRGDKEKRTFYLITGRVMLTDANGGTTTVAAGSVEASRALSPTLPRQHTAIAQGNVEYLSIDTDLLDVMLTWDQTGNYEVSELTPANAAEDEQDWMTILLQTKAFQRIPPANIQAIFMRMKQVNLKEGEVIIKQGAEGDYFYAITKGRCSVIRETPLNKDGIKLAELGVGDTFGEEALISDTRRNATISMLTDGSVMRLSKEDFKVLLTEPMLDWVDYTQAKALVAKGACWLDVRLPSEFASFHEADAINIPLYFIRLKLGTLDKNKTYVVCCDTGRRSSAGAFILNERGFRTHVLRNGLNTSELELE